MINESEKSICFPVVRVTQPIGDFYVGSMRARDLVDISKFDIRQLTRKGNIDDFLGIQRRLDPRRVAEIADYVRLPDSTFPTAVILSIDGSCAQLENVEAQGFPDRFFKLTLRNRPGEIDDEKTVLFRDIARVLDGQHRIQGLADSKTDLESFEVNVSIFIEIDIADQAAIFSTVNLAQTKVNPSLVYDLKSYDKLRSPEKTAHSVTVVLDQNAKSPFFQRIKRLGVATDGRFGELLSQATIVRGMLQYLTSNVMRDREISKLGRSWPVPSSEDRRKLIFRNWFVTEQDDQIALQLMYYFEAVRRRWPMAWDATSPGMMLNRTNGFKALMGFLRTAYNSIGADGRLVKMSEFKALFDKVPLKDDDFTTTNFLPGTSGETKLLRALREVVPDPDYDLPLDEPL